MTNRVRVLALTGALLTAAAAIGDAGGAAIRARVHVVRVTEPGELEVYVSIAPAAANRAYLVTASCRGDQVQSSYRQLEGQRSEGPFAPVVWRNLPGCTYTVATTLLGAGERPVATAPLTFARILCLTCDEEP